MSQKGILLLSSLLWFLESNFVVNIMYHIGKIAHFDMHTSILFPSLELSSAWNAQHVGRTHVSLLCKILNRHIMFSFLSEYLCSRKIFFCSYKPTPTRHLIATHVFIHATLILYKIARVGNQIVLIILRTTFCIVQYLT